MVFTIQSVLNADPRQIYTPGLAYFQNFTSTPKQAKGLVHHWDISYLKPVDFDHNRFRESILTCSKIIAVETILSWKNFSFLDFQILKQANQIVLKPKFVSFLPWTSPKKELNENYDYYGILHSHPSGNSLLCKK